MSSTNNHGGENDDKIPRDYFIWLARLILSFDFRHNNMIASSCGDVVELTPPITLSPRRYVAAGFTGILVVSCTQ